LEDMKKRGVQCIHVYGVDNILVRLGDPVFMGYCISRGAKCGSKAVPKVHPNEAVGVLALRNNTYQVIEYSEIDEERKNVCGSPPQFLVVIVFDADTITHSQQVDASGVLVYNAGNIANHYFTVPFLEEIAESHLEELEFHLANKKIKCLADDGSVIEPTAPNGIKLEMFVFDVFRFSSDLAVLSVLRDEEFSPLKNATGAKDCTPESCCSDVKTTNHLLKTRPQILLTVLFLLCSTLLFTKSFWNRLARLWWEARGWWRLLPWCLTPEKDCRS